MMHYTALYYSMKSCGINLFSPLPADFPKFVWSEVSKNITPASLSSFFFATWQFYGLLDCHYRHTTLIQKENVLLKCALPGQDVC